MKACDPPDDWVCAICSEKYNDSYEDPLMPSFDNEGTPVIGLCGHIFHMICIQKQLLAKQINTTCFTCKKEILCSCKETESYETGSYDAILRYSST